MGSRSYVRYKASYPTLPAESRIRIPVGVTTRANYSLSFTPADERGNVMSTAVLSPSACCTLSELPPPPLRLTARGRAVLSVFGAIGLSIVMAVVIFGGASATASDESGSAESGSASFGSAAFDYVQVEAGQSLWQLAQSVAPDADPREVVYDIVKLNQLATSEVQPGQQLAIPLEYSR